MTDFTITPESPRAPDIVALIDRHLAFNAEAAPPESCHPFDLDGLCKPTVTFWTVREGETLLAIGALADPGGGTAELKSMHTAETARGRGIAAILLRHILDHASAQGITRIDLETGSMDAFAPARALYRRFGFEECPPFGAYLEDPLSTFMTRAVDGNDGV